VVDAGQGKVSFAITDEGNAVLRVLGAR